MPATTEKSALLRGALSTLPFVIVLVPFALLFGVVATEAGLNVAETMGFSVLVIAGAAQFTAIQLMTENAPVWLILAAALAVNLRMAMYAASLQVYFREASLRQKLLIAFGNFDQTYALSMLRFEANPDMPTPNRVGYFLGAFFLISTSWVLSTLFGAVFGGAVLPADLPLDFAMPIMFLAIVGPMLKTPAHLAAAVTSILVALALSGLPSGIGLILAGLAAMAVGAECERRGYGP